MLLSGERLPRPTVGAQSDQDRDEDRIEYLPEQYYLDVGRCSLDEMVRVTAECVTRWAGYYRAYPLRQPELRREGLLPADDQARTALVIELIAWVIAAAGKAELAALALYRGEAPEGWLWDAHDGLPGVLILGRDEFARSTGTVAGSRGTCSIRPPSATPRSNPSRATGGSSGATGTIHRVSGHTGRTPTAAPCESPPRVTEPNNSPLRVTASSWPYCFGSRSLRSPDANTMRMSRRRRTDLVACAGRCWPRRGERVRYPAARRTPESHRQAGRASSRGRGFRRGRPGWRIAANASP
jgi:hypothetical protein